MGGIDWQILRADGAADLDARYTIQADDGALILVTNRAIRHGSPEVMARLNRGERVDPGAYYFRGAVSFETSAEKHAWMTRAVVIASGERYPDGVVIRFWEVL